MNIDCKNNKNYILIIVSFVLASFFVILMDFDLLKSIYEMYGNDSSIKDVFIEDNYNYDSLSVVKNNSIKFVISRLIYSIIPLFITIFIFVIYHSKNFSDKILKMKVFKHNPSLSKILFISRYLLAFGFSFLVLSYKRSFFNSTFHNCLLGYKPDFVRVIIACVVFLVFTIDIKLFVRDIKLFSINHYKISVGLFIVIISIISCFLVEIQIGSKMNVLDYMLHINIMYWFILQLFFFAIFRNVKPGAIVSLLFAYLIGLANDVVYQFRGNYIMFGDLTVIRTAMEVAGNYKYKPTIWFWVSLVLLILSLIYVLFIFGRKTKNIEITNAEKKDIKDKSNEKKNVKNRFISTAIYITLIIAFVLVTFKTGDFYGKVFGVGWDYNENVSVVGYLPYFFSNMDSTTRIKLVDYSSERVEDIFKNYDFATNGDADEYAKDSIGNKEPNIILIQNEAFSDLSITADIETDEDPMEYIHRMSENTEKGYLNMSVTGGPTSNTEFEILSRSSLQFFPYGSVPYTQYLKQNIPSLVRALKNQETPYYTVAYHSYYSSGYNRNSIYDYLGFDKKCFENDFLHDFPESEIPRGYLSDEANYRRVISEFEDNQKTNNPFFCFNVTIQGHGGYDGGPFDLSENVKVTNFEATDSINTYLSSVKMSDTAFKGLVEYFSKVDEPTIIMMYGDHQPSFDDNSKEVLAAHPSWKDEGKQTMSAYYVPYIIWANYDIEEVDNLKPWNEKCDKYYGSTEAMNGLNTLSTNYVGSYLMEKAGLNLSDYDKILLSLHNSAPAMTAIGVWDSEGNYYSDAKSSIFNKELSDLELIQYNLVFDKENKLEEYYLP